MKKLDECRVYWEDVFTELILDNFENIGKIRFDMMEDILTFIYGDEYKSVSASWKQETLNEFWKNYGGSKNESTHD